MICVFGKTMATTNEEYRKVVKNKIKIMVLLMVLGLITFVGVNFFEITNKLIFPDFIKGFYSGMGSALFVAGLVLAIKFSRLLKNEDLLKQSRLQCQDERNVMINYKAVKGAAFIVLIVSYIGLLVAGMFSQAVFMCFWIIIMTFLLSYVFLTVYLNKVS